MRLSPLGLRHQRRRAQILAQQAALQGRQAGQKRRSAIATMERRVTRPESLALALVAGLLVGTLSPQGRPAKSGEAEGSKRRPVRNNLAVKQLVRASRAFVISRLLGAFAG